MASAAIGSILAQTMTDLELLVVDDGADAPTREAVEALAGCDARLKTMNNPGEGLVAALNYGCAMARGKYIARMDADDFSRPARLALQVAALEACPKLGIVGGQVQFCDTKGEITWLVAFPLDDAAVRAMLPHANPFAHPAVTMRRDAFVAAGGYRGTCPRAEDYELWARLLDNWCGGNVPEVVLDYRVHPDQSMFRDWEQQTLSMLVVQAAIKLKASTGEDKLAAGATLGEELLHSIGVSARQLESSYVSSLVSQALLAHRIQAHDRCRQALTEARARAKKVRLEKYAVRRMWEVAAVVAWDDHQTLQAANALVHSLPQQWRKPLRVARRLLARPKARLLRRR